MRYLEGPHRDREVSADFGRVRLIDPKGEKKPTPIEKPAPIVEKRVARSAIPADSPFAGAMQASQIAEEPETPKPYTDDIDAQVNAWLEMGSELLAPLEARAKELDDDIVFVNAQLAELEEDRARLGRERQEVEHKLQRVRRLIGAK